MKEYAMIGYRVELEVKEIADKLAKLSGDTNKRFFESVLYSHLDACIKVRQAYKMKDEKNVSIAESTINHFQKLFDDNGGDRPGEQAYSAIIKDAYKRKADAEKLLFMSNEKLAEYQELKNSLSLLIKDQISLEIEELDAKIDEE